jgi:hypothetical protein
MHQELLHEALQEEEVRGVVIEVEHDASEDEEEHYAADYEDYEQGDSKKGSTPIQKAALPAFVSKW